MSTERRRNVAASSSNGCTQLGTLCGAALVASRSTCSNMSRQLLVKGVPAIQHAYVHKCTQLARCAVLLASPAAAPAPGQWAHNQCARRVQEYAGFLWLHAVAQALTTRLSIRGACVDRANLHTQCQHLTLVK